MRNNCIIKLGSIGKISMCKRVLKNQTSPIGEIPFYKISTFGFNADCYISRDLFEKYKSNYSFPNVGEILISAAGTIGRTVIYNGEEAFFQDSNIVWVDNDESIILNSFLYYFYKLNPWKKTTGSTIDRLYNNNLKDIDVYYPSDIVIQKRIVSILKSIDSKIENNNKIATELEAMAKTIYDYWFLQFDFPNENGRLYKSSGCKMVWNDELKREIPEGWEVCALSELCQLTNGINYEKNEQGNSVYKIVNVRNISESSLLIDTSKLDNIVLNNNRADKYLVGDDDILIARSGNPGAIRLLYSIDKSIIYCGFIIKCALNNRTQRLYMAYTLKKYEGTNATKTGGSILQNVSQDTLNRLKILIPPQSIINKFNQVISHIVEKEQQCIDESNELASLRDFLLPMLMNGQVGFKDIE